MTFLALKYNCVFSSSLSKEFLSRLENKSDDYSPLLVCHDGGVVSETAAILVKLTRCEVSILRGGYVSYRQYVQDHLSLEDRKDYRQDKSNASSLFQFRKSGKPQVHSDHWTPRRGQSSVHPEPGGQERGAGAGPGHHVPGGARHPGDVRIQDHAQTHLAVLNRQSKQFTS